MCTNNGQRERCGFTLIELMVVVIVIAVLAAIAIPAFSQHRSDAELSVCLENLRLIQAALSIYQENEGVYPLSADDLVGYLERVPVCPLGGPYNWDLHDDRYHIRCGAQHTPEINHVCIHEDRGPTAR